MDGGSSEGSEARFAGYVEALGVVLGHADRQQPMHDYCLGLLMPIDPQERRTDGGRDGTGTGRRQASILASFCWQCAVVGRRDAGQEPALAKAGVAELVLPAIERSGPVEAWIIDDTGFPKKGTHSVGVARQYCGQLGKQDNCQVAVSLSLANRHASLPVAYRLYLPEAWASDAARRSKTGVPEEIAFKTKPEIALEQIRAACAAGLPCGVVLMDAGYGTHSDLRTAVMALELPYVAGILSNTTVWAPGTRPLPPKAWKPGHGRPTKRLRRDAAHQPVKDLAFSLPAKAWRTITWREGTNVPLRSRFARLRVRIARRDFDREPWPEEWLMIEWPREEKEPTKYWLSSLPDDIGFSRLVDLAKLRWRIERDYQDLKQEVGLGHFEGRGWRGFHHHASLCIAAYGFLISEQETIPPSEPRSSPHFQAPRLPEDYRPRGATAQD